MINPLSIFKQSLLKSTNILGKTFILDISKPIKTLNKVDILVDVLKSVQGVNLSDFDSVKSDIERGSSLEQAIKKEIESWEPEIINLIISKYIELIKNQETIDFKKLPDLRIYWKLRKIFTKEEIDSWSDVDYQWAIYNLQQDEIEKDEFDDRNLEKRKPWMNLDLYNHINQKEEEKQQQDEENKLLIQKLMEKEGLDPNKYEIELVDEQEEIPTIIEEE